MNKFYLLSCALLITLCSSAQAATLIVPMKLIAPTGAGKSIGTITFTDTQYGMVIKPVLSDLPPGLHGFHLHVNPSCADSGMAAGGHYDPLHTTAHLGPYTDQGHQGDLPALYVDEKGIANLQLEAPRLKVQNLYGHALIIHAAGDNYSDHPEKLGGGGARIACGVIPVTAVQKK